MARKSDRKHQVPERGDAGTPPGSGEDYTQATGRDHPAESEHDHARQKLHGESAKMAKTPVPERAKR